MESRITDRFRKCFDDLPQKVKAEARKSFKIWKTDPYIEKLKFKKIHSKENMYSIRIGLNWRALGIKDKTPLFGFGLVLIAITII